MELGPGTRAPEKGAREVPSQACPDPAACWGPQAAGPAPVRALGQAEGKPEPGRQEGAHTGWAGRLVLLGYGTRVPVGWGRGGRGKGWLQ